MYFAFNMARGFLHGMTDVNHHDNINIDSGCGAHVLIILLARCCPCFPSFFMAGRSLQSLLLMWSPGQRVCDVQVVLLFVLWATEALVSREVGVFDGGWWRS